MPSDKPNVLHLCTDGQRFDTVAALGNPVIQTPNLDRLSHEGTAFTSTYTPTAMCTPARASMLYGRYPYRNPERFWPDENESESFVERLANEGYRTHAVGKVDFPAFGERRGFGSIDVHEELMAEPEHDGYLTSLRAAGYDHLIDSEGVRGEIYYTPQVAQMPAEHHVAQWTADRALDFIDGQDDQPWYLFCSWTGPRPPIAPPAPWYKLYRGPLMPDANVPPESEALLTHINRVQNRYKFKDGGIDRHAVQALKAFYYAAISFIDFQMGRLLERLEKAGTLDDTLIVFHSDHGELLGDYDSFGLRSFHDASARIPLIVRYPGRFEAGARIERVASLVDIAPTLLAAAGLEPGRQDGVDLAALAADEVERDFVYNYYLHNIDFLPGGVSNRPAAPDGFHSPIRNGIYTIVSDAHKYAYSAADDREYLIDRQRDPAETRNVAGNPFYAGVQATLRDSIIDELRSAGATKAIDGDSWRRFPPLESVGDSDAADAGLLMQDQAWASVDLPGYDVPPLQVDPVASPDRD